MSTNKILTKSVEQLMSDFVPVNTPILPLFLGKSQAYSQDVGELKFRRLSAVGDIRSHHITPKDTEIKQIAVMDGRKTFKKYFLASQYTSSTIQDQDSASDIVNQILDEQLIHMDSIFMTGEGTAGNNVVNNGLYWSGDSNYTLETSTEVKKDADDNYLASLHAKMMVTAEKADQVAGRKIMLVYGSNFKPLFDSVYPTGVRSFKAVLQEVLGANWNVIKVPDASTPSGAQGWLAANLDQTKLHYTVLPNVLSQGQNEEKMYYWVNFMMGSCMLDVLAANGVVRQPATLEA
jgi:hypothetical protein